MSATRTQSSSSSVLRVRSATVGPVPRLDLLNDQKVFPHHSVSFATKVASVCGFLSLTSMFVYLMRENILASLEWGSSPLDWCEENYTVHSSIAEFWNTLSSLCMCLTALTGPLYYVTSFHRHEPNMYMVWCLMMFVGLGSCYFHGSLSIAGQVLDELPITLINFFGLAVARPLHKWNTRWREIVFDWPFFLCTTIGSTALCLVYPVLSHVICVTCIPMSIYSFSTEYRSCPDRKRIAPIFRSAVIWFSLAFGAWVIDRVACGSLTTIFSHKFEFLNGAIVVNGFYPQLHAWWHIFISGCFWSLVSLGVAIRVSGDRKSRVGVYYLSQLKVFPVTSIEEI